MRRSPLALVALAVLVACMLTGCSDDGDDTTATTTTAAPVPTDASAALAVCAPLSALVGVFVDLSDLATGSAEGRAAADTTVTTALDQIEEIEPDPSPDVAAALETLRDARFEAPEGPTGDDTDTAVATLTDQLGGECGDLGG